MNLTTVPDATPGLDLAEEDNTMTPTRVETKLIIEQITGTKKSKQWDTYLCSSIWKERYKVSCHKYNFLLSFFVFTYNLRSCCRRYHYR